MTRGQILFEIHRRHLEFQGVSSDGWDCLDAADQAAWEALAAEIDYEQSDDSLARYGRATS